VMPIVVELLTFFSPFQLMCIPFGWAKQNKDCTIKLNSKKIHFIKKL
jgi:hypothetical protein